MKIFKRSLIILGMLVFSIAFIACGSKSSESSNSATNSKPQIEKPEKTVSAFFDALKKVDVATASKYVKSDNKEKDVLKFETPEQDNMAKLIFGKLSYEIGSSTVTDNSAKVKVKITSPDLSETSKNMMDELLTLSISKEANGSTLNKDEAQKLMLNKLIATVNDVNTPKLTSEIEINLVKNNGNTGWLIEPNTDLINAMTGNLIKADIDKQ